MGINMANDGTITWDNEPEECPGCRVAPNSYHDDGCDHARCPGCGEQLLMCGGCGDDKPALWHGIHPEEEAAVWLGWWYAHPSPGIPIVPDTTMAKGFCEWDTKTQRYTLPSTPANPNESVLRWEEGVNYERLKA